MTGLNDSTDPRQDEDFQQYRAIMKVLDRVFGIIAGFFLCFQLVKWSQGQASATGPAVLLTLLVRNATLSLLALRHSEYRFRFELFRFLFLNPLLATALYLTMNGPLSPFCIPYAMISIGMGPALFGMPEKRWRIGVQILNVINFLAVSALHRYRDQSLGDSLQISALLIMVGILTEYVLGILRKSMYLQKLQATELLSQRQELQKKEQFYQTFVNHFPGKVCAKAPDGAVSGSFPRQ